ncbi:MAG: hypothetical protein ACREBU_17365 [Nitrososphaera sp.]
MMVGLIEYNDRKRDLDEELLSLEFCSTSPVSQQDSCNKNTAIGLAYASDRVAESYRTITLGSITVASGIALFLTSYLRPSWFRRIAVETT